MISRLIPALAIVLGAAALAPAVGLAEPSSPAVEQRRQAPASADAESEYDRGVRARVAKDWVAAVDAFHRALALRAAFSRGVE